MSEKQKWRDRKFRMVLYPEDMTHVEAIEKLQMGGYNFVAMLHDKDVADDGETIKKAHWHIVIKFKNAVWSTAIAKELGITPNYLDDCANLDAAILYLVHYSQPEKFQYPYEEAFGPLKVKLASLLADTDEGTRAISICDLIDAEPGFISYSDAIRKTALAGLFGDFRRLGSLGVGLINEHNRVVFQSLCGDDFNELDRQNFGNFCTTKVPFNKAIPALDRKGLLKPNIQKDELDRIRKRIADSEAQQMGMEDI